MKKLLFLALMVACVLVFGVTAFAAEETANEDVILIMPQPTEDVQTEEAVAEIAIDTEKMATDAIVIDGTKLEIAPNMGKMVEKDGVVFAPVRVVLEAMGYQVNWTDAEQMVMCINASNGTIIIAQVNNALLFYTDGQEEGRIEMEAETFLNLDECRTYIPVNALAQALGYKVGFDTEINTVTLSK